MPRVRLTADAKPSLLCSSAMQSATPPAPDEKVESSRGLAPVRHPRGRLAPPLAKDAPRWKRIARAAHRARSRARPPRRAARRAGDGVPLLPEPPAAARVRRLRRRLIARRRGVDAVLSPLLDNLPGTAESVVKKEVERLAGAERHRARPRRGGDLPLDRLGRNARPDERGRERDRRASSPVAEEAPPLSGVGRRVARRRSRSRRSRSCSGMPSMHPPERASLGVDRRGELRPLRARARA